MSGFESKTPMGLALAACGLSYAGLSTMLGVSIGTVNSKMSGRSRFTASQARHLVREFGENGQAFVDAVDEHFRRTRPDRLVSDRAPIILDEPEQMRLDEDEEPVELVTIQEWKRRYGEPGLAVDVHGRMLGYFATDPDFCE